MKRRRILAKAKKDFLFDNKREWYIYRFLCDGKLKRREKKKISGILFERYNDWKDYVINKYQNYESHQLIEFSRFLNHQIRESKSFTPIIIMYFSPVVAFYISLLGDKLLNVNYTKQNTFAICIGIIVCLALIIMVAYNMYSEENMKNGFYEDYKEIIDELIERKNQEQNQPL